MARRVKESHQDVPVYVARYDRLVHGPGDAGVDTWRFAAAGWLKDNPGRTLPVGN